MQTYSTDSTLVQRFWPKVLKGPDTDCWLWQRATQRGYGVMTVMTERGRRTIVASRISYAIAFGGIPDGMYVCHNCPGGDNPLCVNPAHLFLGTQDDNMKDAARKKRVQHGSNHWTVRNPELIPRGDRHGSRTHPESVTKGEKNAQAKLTEADVLAIRDRYATRREFMRVIAADYGICREAVRDIIHRKRWAHI